MKFRTEYPVQPAGFTLNPNRPTVLVGSCFADNILGRMQVCRAQAVNPFGVLFNPLSIARAINLALSNDETEVHNSIFEKDGIYHSWLFDSGFSSRDRFITGKRIAEALALFREKISSAEALFVTFGTAWCYFLNTKNNPVAANCHKQPQELFTRRRISGDEIFEVWKPLLAKLRTVNPDLRVIFTVSPVRHLKDGFVENSRSKATLILAVEELCRAFDYCSYFPAYEIINDDLRDYRFYAADLAHPSEQAVDYIWEVFQSTYYDASARQILKDGERATRRERHRPIIS